MIKTQAQHFNLSATLECGQFFRYARDGDGYRVITGGKTAYISQKDDICLFHDAEESEFPFWRRLFDLDRDYGSIIETLSNTDPVLRKACAFAPGIRIMNQEPWETLLCFIISANNRIPMIMKVVQNMAERFGGGTEIPAPHVLKDTPVEDVVACKAGFRAKYIIDAALRAAEGSLILDGQADIHTDELRRVLMTVKGVGVKVADCVMLFAYGRREVFPIDVWIGRVMRKLYFNGADVSLNEIRAFAAERFGAYAGYANQFLFNYARINKII